MKAFLRDANQAHYCFLEESVSIPNCRVLGHTGLCRDSSPTMTLSSALAHHICHDRAGNNLWTTRRRCAAAVPLQEVLPFPLAIPLLSAHVPRGRGVFSVGSRQVWGPSSGQQTPLWSGRTIWRTRRPRLVSLTHTWRVFL